MRRFVVALVVAALAFTVAGCGGGGAEVEAPDPAAQAPAPAAPAATEPPGYLTDRSATEETTPTAFPSFTTTETPAVFADKLSAGRPMLIFFYDPAQISTNDVRAEIDAVMRDYRGLIDLVTFNTGEKVQGQSVPTDSAKAAVVYANELGVNSTPYIVMVDGGGFITWRWKGFVDRGYIEREVERATQ